MNNKNKIKVNDSFIANSLRNCGYNNYTAIADIVDNSIEPEVGSSFVKVDFDTDGKGSDKTIVKSILIIDDGLGMSSETLEEAMKLGANTGKNCIDNLGVYGTGLKSASLSIGQVLEVYTKTEESLLNYAKISIKDAIYSNGEIFVEYNEFPENSEEYHFFNEKTNSDHGTIVKISELDRISNSNYQSFKGTLYNKIGEIFNKYIYSNVVKFYVGKKEVKYIDLMGCVGGNILMGEGTFKVEDHLITFKSYFLPPCGGEDSNLYEGHEENSIGEEYLPRTMANQGLYIYRNNRLVGKALTLGMYVKDNWKNGHRTEVFMDGSCDYLFGSTFTKMIQEKTKDNMSQSLFDAMTTNIGPYINETQKRQKQITQSNSKNDPELEKATADFYKRVVDKQNKNMLLRANRRGENSKRNDDDDKIHTIRGKQKNPNPIKERTNKWLGGFKEIPLGRNGEMFNIEHINNKPIININTDHPYFQNFYSKLDNDLKYICAQIISCEELAKQKVNYYGSEEVRNYIDCFNDCKSSEVMKSLLF